MPRNSKKRYEAFLLGETLLDFADSGDRGKLRQRINGHRLNFREDEGFRKLLKQVRKRF